MIGDDGIHPALSHVVRAERAMAQKALRRHVNAVRRSYGMPTVEAEAFHAACEQMQQAMTRLRAIAPTMRLAATRLSEQMQTVHHDR